MNMAKRKYSKSKKIEPSVLRLSFNLPRNNSEGNGISYVDLSQCASLVNRRFYRQGINWAVAGITFVNVSGAVFSGSCISSCLHLQPGSHLGTLRIIPNVLCL